MFQINLALVFVVGVFYLSEVANRQKRRLVHLIRHEERKAANQRRPLSDVETVRWVNTLIERVWPIWLERFVSQEVVPALAPWFFEKYKPWQIKKAVLQRLYLGSTPPLIATARTLPSPGYEDHVILEMAGELVVSDDMYAVISGQPRLRLGLGMWASCHVSKLILEGKFRVGIKFLPEWPYIARMRLSFAGAPYVSLQVRPLVNFGIDVAELPGIAGWLDKILASALENSMVEPNMLEVDVQKLVEHYAPTLKEGLVPPSTPAKPTDFFHVKELPPCASVLIELIEAKNLRAADSNGYSDPYVKGALGSARFKSSVKRRTVNPVWFEEFRAPIASWNIPNLLVLRVRDKDMFKSDELGYCVFDLNQERFRTGQRFEFWENLRRVKTGRVHVAITIFPDVPQEPSPSGREREGGGPAGAPAEAKGASTNRVAAGGQPEAVEGAASRRKSSLRGDPLLEDPKSKAAARVPTPPRSPQSPKKGGSASSSLPRDISLRNGVESSRSEGDVMIEKRHIRIKLPEVVEEDDTVLLNGTDAPVVAEARDLRRQQGFRESAAADEADVLSLEFIVEAPKEEAPKEGRRKVSPRGAEEEEADASGGVSVPAASDLPTPSDWRTSSRSAPHSLARPGEGSEASVEQPRRTKSAHEGMASASGAPSLLAESSREASPSPSPSPARSPRRGFFRNWAAGGKASPHPSPPPSPPREEFMKQGVGEAPEDVEWTDDDDEEEEGGEAGFTPNGEADGEEMHGEPSKVWAKHESLREVGESAGRVSDEIEPIDVDIEPVGFLRVVRPGQAIAEPTWKGRAGGRKSEAAAMAGYMEGEGRKSKFELALESLRGKNPNEKADFDEEGVTCTWRGEQQEAALNRLDQWDENKATSGREKARGRTWAAKQGKTKKQKELEADRYKDAERHKSLQTTVPGGELRSEATLSPNSKLLDELRSEDGIGEDAPPTEWSTELSPFLSDDEDAHLAAGNSLRHKVREKTNTLMKSIHGVAKVFHHKTNKAVD